MPTNGSTKVRLPGGIPAVVAAMAVAFLVTGCANARPEAPTSAWESPAGVVTPTSTPTPVALTVAEAGPRYLAIVAPYNNALQEFAAAVKAGRSLPSLRTLAGKVAKANAAHARELRGTAWPAQARAPMSALLKETDTAQRYWQQAAEAQTATAMNTALRGASEHDGGEPASQVRSALGLPAYRKS